MRRRKLLISIGALGAGGTAAFGTEAFTSVEAERSVDVEVAGDSSAFLAIQPLSGNNANQYVSMESDDTVALDFDGDAGTSGSGVNQDAITQVEDLFKIINQGTQPTSVFFEDDSDAVTFRVTRSTDTSTQGPEGESLEGADSSVELETGEQVAVGITVDTKNNDVSGSLVDNVTIRAEAGASAPGQNIPEPQYVVSESPDGPNQFGDIQSAVDQLDSGNEDQENAVVGIEGGFSETISGTNSSDITIDIPGTILTGFGSGSTPEITRKENTEGLVVNASDVTVRNVKIIDGPGDGDKGQILNIDNGPSGVTIDGVTFEGAQEDHGGSVIGTDAAIGDNLTVTNCEVRNGALGFGLADGASAEITNNSVEANTGDGIFVSASGNNNLNIENNEATSVPDGQVGIKVTSSNVTVNGETGTINALETLLAENSINRASVDGTERTRSIISERVVADTVGDLNDRAGFLSIQDAINGNNPENGAADEKINTGGTVLVESGTFENVSIDVEGLTLEGPNAGIDGDSSDRGTEATIDGGVFFDNQDSVTVDGFEIERSVVSGEGVVQLGSGGPARIGENAVIKNNVINADPAGDRNMAGVLFEGDPQDDLFVENNLITQTDGTPVQAVTNFESEIGTLEITDNTIDTGSAISLGVGSSNITATISENEFTDSFEARPAVVIVESDDIDVSIDNNTFDGVVAGIRTTSSTAPVSSPNVSVDVTNNEFIDDDTAWFVEDNLGVLDLDEILNNQGNSFDPAGEVDGKQIVVQ